MHGGSALQHIPFNLPGFKGLNSQARGAIIGPEWATLLANTVIDDNNRLSARNGWFKTTTVAAAQDFEQLVEYDNAGSKEIIATGASNALYMSDDGGSTWSTVTGTATVTDPNMQFALVNGVLYGLQDGGTIITYSGTTFSNNGASGEPTGGVGIGAFGRLWAKDTATTLKYSALLDPTDFSGTDSGTFSLTSVWKEQDEIVAISEFNGNLVIFSKNNIVLYTDGQGSALGLDPVTAYISETVNGIGCAARDSVVNVKGDIWFLDDTGIHSLGRLVQSESNPLQNISFHVQDELIDRLSLMADKTVIRATYSPKDRFYLLCLPSGSGATELGSAFCFDTRGPMQDGTFRCMGIWEQMVPRAVITRDNLDVVSALLTKTGEVGTYFGYLDDTDPYTLDYEGGWTNIDNPAIKILKRISAIAVIGGDVTINFKWGFDFEDSLTNSASVLFSGGQDPSEFGIGEYGIAEYGAGAAALEKKAGGKGTGEYVKIGFTAIANTTSIALQQINLYTKLGRLK
jgi:hypothetical protein